MLATSAQSVRATEPKAGAVATTARAGRKAIKPNPPPGKQVICNRPSLQQWCAPPLINYSVMVNVWMWCWLYKELVLRATITHFVSPQLRAS